MVCGMSRPVIGICTALERARWSVWDEQAVLLPRSYVSAVQRAGGLAVMLAPDAAAAEDPSQLLELIDGLVLAGGADIDPASYGQPAHAKTTHTVPERDAFEIALVREAIELAGARFVLGVQWHPEADESSVVVGALVAAAEEAARGVPG